MWIELGIILLLILVNGVFAGAEIAVIALRKSRLLQLAAERRPGVQAVLALRNEPERFLATVQIGITIIGATAAAFGGASIAVRLAPVLARLPLSARAAEDLALALVIALISYLSLVLGELVPKSLALRASERYALLVGRPLRALAWLARPLVWLLTRSSNLMLRPFGDQTSFTEARLSPEEIQQLVEEAGKTGALDHGTSEIASRALDFGSLKASDVMVPRNRVVGIPRDATAQQIRQVILEEGHSRMPVYDETLDAVIGYVTARDVLAVAWQGELIVLQDILRPALFVPTTAPAIGVLKELQRRHTRIAFVVDEHGGMAGLVTLEDLVEEVVGELFSEHEQPLEPMRHEPDGSVVVRGDLPIREANRLLGLDLPEGASWTTVAGLVIAAAGGIPQRGTSHRVGDLYLDVVDATTRSVREVRIRRGDAAVRPPGAGP